MTASPARMQIRVRGAVQGVGFRPFVYRLAHALGVAGWVSNDVRGVIIEAEHSCMTIRGGCKPGSVTVTSALRGLFKTNPTTRGELMALVRGGK